MSNVKSYISDMSLLFIDDEDGVRESYVTLLSMWAKKVYSASNGKEGLEVYKKYKPDVIVTDIKMPVMSGLEMIEEIKKIDSEVPIIITTAHQEPELLLDSIEYHVDSYMVKPIPKKKLKKRLENIGKVLQVEKELIVAQELNKLYLDISGVFISRLDKDANIVMINKSGLDIIGYAEDELLGKNLFDFKMYPQEDIEGVKAYFKKLISGEVEDSRENYQNKLLSKDGKTHVMKWSNTLLKEKGEVVGLLTSGVDITDLDNARKDLEEQSYMDALIDIYNRKYYYVKIFELLSLYERYGTPFSILMYDIDNFKEINDNYGHVAGDDVLIQMSQLIKSHIRKNDYLFRVGGEEFVILFSDTCLDKSKIVAQKIRKSVEEDLKTIKDKKITISIGVTEVNKNDDGDTIYKRVDDLLYASKHAGKNKVSF